ncbi:hypothetical protein F4553_000014 [Allocatelliglobosispora scoriae]|uniref:Uncharacterized protein n=1 Tax=Allocatelliglobosispora scoriae TaxID=643052 RepID=A0A841BG80_9ACTN|nr:hypothetical protein [Allocatelliglobosispora scoriae]MBB5866635.1 hypothetical protein [Allocatelliglobosispora scoriae]
MTSNGRPERPKRRARQRRFRPGVWIGLIGAISGLLVALAKLVDSIGSFIH